MLTGRGEQGEAGPRAAPLRHVTLRKWATNSRECESVRIREGMRDPGSGTCWDSPSEARAICDFFLLSSMSLDFGGDIDLTGKSCFNPFIGWFERLSVSRGTQGKRRLCGRSRLPWGPVIQQA